MKVRIRKSRTVDALANRLKNVARGEAAAMTAEEMAPAFESQMKRDIKPHRRTGVAEAKSRATASHNSITLENVRYLRYVKGVIWGRRVPADWFTRLRKKLVANTRKVLRGV